MKRGLNRTVSLNRVSLNRTVPVFFLWTSVFCAFAEVVWGQQPRPNKATADQSISVPHAHDLAERSDAKRSSLDKQTAKTSQERVLQIARAYLVAEQADRAVRHLSNEYRDTNNATMLLYRYEIHLRQEQHRQALQVLEQYLSQNATCQSVMDDLASVRHFLDKPAIALSQGDTSKSATAADLGKLLYGFGRFEEAAEAYQRAYRFNAKPKFLYETFRAYEKAGDLSHAAMQLRQYLRRNPQDPQRAELKLRLQSLQRESKQGN